MARFPVMNLEYTSFRLQLPLALGAALWLFAGCVDLTEPWKTGGTGGAGGLGSDAELAIDGASQSGGAGGGGASGGSGGFSSLDGNVVTDVAGSGGVLDAPLGGAGGTLDGGMGGGAGVIDTGGSLSDGSPDAPMGGTGGSATGGTAGTRDAGAGGAGGVATGGTAGLLDASLGGTGGTMTADAPVVETGRDSTNTGTDTILSTGLVVYYTCEQSSGTTLPDLSGSGNHGTLLAGPAVDGGTPPSAFGFETGKLGNALTLSQAGGGHVSIPAGVFKGAAEVTIATWIRLKTLTTWQRIFDIGINANLAQNASTGTVYMTFFLKDFSNKLAFSSTKDGYGSAQQVGADAFSTGVWKHVAVVLGPGGGTLYIDGVSAGESSSLLPPQGLGAIDYAFIGKSQFAGDPFLDAQIDEFRVYNRALSASEIRVLFQYLGP